VSDIASLVPREVTVALAESEVAAVTASAERWGWSLEIDLTSDAPLFTFGMVHPVSGDDLRLAVDLTGYRAVPPAWRFVDANGVQDPSLFPATAPNNSLFHSNRVICAPWNRIAYLAEEGGPHSSDWGDATRWLTIDNVTRATTIADMAAIIRINLAASPGLMP
jgi:hypothetical protein